MLGNVFSKAFSHGADLCLSSFQEAYKEFYTITAFPPAAIVVGPDQCVRAHEVLMCAGLARIVIVTVPYFPERAYMLVGHGLVLTCEPA